MVRAVSEHETASYRSPHICHFQQNEKYRYEFENIMWADLKRRSAPLLYFTVVRNVHRFIHKQRIKS